MIALVANLLSESFIVFISSPKMQLSKFSEITFTLILLLIISYFQRRKKRLLQEISRTVYNKLSKKSKKHKALNHQIVSQCLSLQNPSYIPPVLFSGSWANMALSYAKQSLYEKFFYSKSKFREKIHVLADGGRSAYVWLEKDVLLPPTAPILFILHTICGQISHLQMLMDYCVLRGWRPCALIRRGHLQNKPLSRPCFNLLGDANDTHSQVKAALSEYPDAEFSGMIGLSAGAALIANYLGKFGEKALVQAGCCVCPAYDLEYAFQKIYTQQPTLDGCILGWIKKLFLEPNSKLLSECYPEAYRECSQAVSLHEFVLSHAKFAGCEDSDEYWRRYNPAHVFKDIKVAI